VPPERLCRTVEVTRIAGELHRSGWIPGDPAFVEDHLDAVIVGRDPQLLEALERRVLAPLEGLGATTRQRMVDTLRSWLCHQGDVQRVADELCIHPQTVRYRLAQLRERFGPALESPRERARLLLVLAWPPPG
jgi:DNA-binding PucR family transcriptional regulator